MAAKLALIVMELITILYLAIGKTPADALIFIGVDAPLSLNRYLFQFGSQIQVIIGTCAFIWLNRSIKECYFPRRGDGIELRSESMPTPPKTAEEKGELHA